MINPQADVYHFHEKMGVKNRDRPTVVDDIDEINLRTDLHDEEVNELAGAMLENDLVGIADGIADAIYVLLGTACVYGIHMDDIWAEVHRSNMEKRPGVRGENGKILKPEGWQPPNIARCLARQMGLEVDEPWISFARMQMRLEGSSSTATDLDVINRAHQMKNEAEAHKEAADDE